MKVHEYQTACLPYSPEGVAKAANLLQAGEVVALPSETVYGLAADATQASAIAKIYAAKGRPSYNPLIVHIGEDLKACRPLVERRFLDLAGYSEDAVKLLDLLMKEFWPGPLTLVLPRGEAISPQVAQGLDTVGFRMPNHPAFQDVLRCTGLPLAAPSANRSNRVSPTESQHVLRELGGKIPLVLDGGPTELGLESTIVAILPDGTMNLLRQGTTAVEDLIRFAKRDVAVVKAMDHKPSAPGMLREHYAPSKPLLLFEEAKSGLVLDQLRGFAPVEHLALVKLGTEEESLDPRVLAEVAANIELVSFPADDRLIAKNLFRTLHALDQSKAQVIVIDLLESRQSGLWPAIHDRLNRAAARWKSCAIN